MLNIKVLVRNPRNRVLFILHKRRVGMYKTFEALLTIIWILDIINLPFMQFLDTTIPINTLAWFLIIMLMPSSEN